MASVSLTDALAQVRQRMQAGAWDTAEAMCRQIVAAVPTSHEAHRLLGLVELSRRQPQNAVPHFETSLQLHTRAAETYDNLAVALMLLGRLTEAETTARQALALNGRFPEAWQNLGLILEQQGQLSQAVAAFRQALQLRPQMTQAAENLARVERLLGAATPTVPPTVLVPATVLAPAPTAVPATVPAAFPDSPHLSTPPAKTLAAPVTPADVQVATAAYQRGNQLYQSGQLSAAADEYLLALKHVPHFAEALSNLGNVHYAQRHFADAEAAFRQAVAVRPELADAWNNLGALLQDQGRFAEAVAVLKRALSLKPRFAPCANNLSNAYQGLGQPQEALRCLQQAVEWDPQYADAWYNLGLLQLHLGQLDTAITTFQRAMNLKPRYAEAANNLGIVYNALGRVDEAAEMYRLALSWKSYYPRAKTNLLLNEHYRPGVTLARLAELHREWNEQFGKPLLQTTHWSPQRRDPHKRLRLGFLSADLGQHPVGHFLSPLLTCLDRSQQQVICYSNGARQDAIRHTLHQHSDLWREVEFLNDDDLTTQIRQDEIDILFDLAGHSRKNRLLVFARKPAPLQITWMGYVGTTGLTAIDYLLADRYHVLPGTESHFVEGVLRMPHGYICYAPPSNVPDVQPLPALTKGAITFGSLNNPAKLNSQVIGLWSQILARVPDSRLLLKYRGFDEPDSQQRLRASFGEHGITGDRLIFSGQASAVEMMRTYAQIDLALDPCPYSGGLTTLEALWMGVPVITCPGETFASRHSLSHLTNAGCQEFVTSSFTEYVELAVTLAADLPRLAQLRSTLRDRLANSPVCNGPQFAHDFTQLMRHIWTAWCTTSHP